MATLEELHSALINADAAGDTAAATFLANTIKEQTPQQQQPSQAAALTRSAISGMFGGGEFAPDMAQGLASGPIALAQMATSGWDAGKRAVGAVSDALNNQYQKFDPQNTQGSGIAQVLGASLLPGAAATKLPAAVGIGAKALQGAGVGAAQAALTPVDNAANMDARDLMLEKAKQAALGAGIGAAAPVAGTAIGRVISPQASPAAQQMIDANISMTPGQRLGGFAKSVEDKLTSIPGLGDLINWNRSGGLDNFNRAIYNKILAPIGKTYEGPIGQAALASIKKTASQAYETVLDKASPAPITQDFAKNLNDIAAMVPLSKRADFVDFVNRQVLSKATPAGTLTPSVAKAADSVLGQRGSAYMGASDPDARIIGQAYQQAAREVRDLFAQANPHLADEMAGANSAWSQLVQLQNAAKGVKVARNDGVVTPADYLKGILQSDKSMRDTKFSSGLMPNQDFAQAADKILPNKYPDSGTFGRAAMGAVLGTAGGVFPGVGVPAGIAAGAASLPYLPGIRNLASMALNSRPDSMRAVGKGLIDLAPYLSAPAVAGLLGNRP